MGCILWFLIGLFYTFLFFIQESTDIDLEVHMIHSNDDTIAAIATAASDAGIGIIRVSGTRAIEAVSHFYQNAKHEFDLQSHQSGTIRFGYFCDTKGDLIDEVMVSVMRAPHSYTKEDVVEVNTHGGTMVMQKILHELISDENICRLAEPGEFTKRAFLNGRIDLTRAEAVMDIIEAKSEFALNNSEKQLRGDMRNIIEDMRSKIIYEMAYIESALDDPENYDLTGYEDRIMPICDKIIRNCDKLIKSADEGRVRATGLSTVIIGKPNSGKSSLLNVLTGEETAIVTDIAGTTRDVIEHDVKLGNILLHVIDTAGIRDSADKIEAIGVEKARKYAREAELILYMIDSTSQINDEDIEILTSVKDKKIIVLLNKTDKEDEIIITKDNISKLLETVGVSSDVPVITTSMILGNGIDELKNAISDLFFNGKLVPEDEIYVTNLRHKNLLEKAYRSLCLVKNSVEQGLSEDFYTIDLHDAYESLGLIIGEEVGDDLVEEIFSKFCMGK